VKSVWVERNGNITRGTATAGAVTYLEDTNLIGALGSVDTAWRISIYYGTGTGQIRSVSTADNTTGRVVPTVDWTTAPDSTSKYALWNPSEQTIDWFRDSSLRFDAKEYPDTLHFTSAYTSLYGMRIRIEYVYTPEALTTELSTTAVDSEYIIAKACSILHGQMISDTRYNRELHYGESLRYGEAADDILRRHRVDQPDQTIWIESNGMDYRENNPMNWS